MSRTKREMPTFFSFEIGPIRSLAEAMTDEEWGRWSKNALNDLSIGCVKKDTDPRVIAVFEKAKGNMDKEYKRKSKWYHDHVGNANDKQEKEQKHNETQTKPQVTEMKKTPDQLVWGQFENVLLTQKQHDDFCVHVGNVNEAKKIIDSLSCKIADGTKTSINHYATLISWADWQKKKDSEKEQGRETYAEREGRRQIEQLRKCGLLK